MKFTLEAFCNPHLPEGSRRVDVVLTGRCDMQGGAPGLASGKLEYGLLIDRSGSMKDDDRMIAAKRAARLAVSRLPDGVRFFVVAFNHESQIVVSSAIASPESRALADRRIGAIEAGGGTAMSSALTAACGEFTAEPGAVRVCQLLTDGENAGEDEAALKAAIKNAQGRFQCESRGVGDGWRAVELLQISNALLGSAKAAPSGADLERDLRETFAMAQAKGAADIRIRLIIPPKLGRIVSLRQAAPEIVDLTPLAARLDDRTIEFPTGAWGDEERDFHAIFEVNQPGSVGEQVRICRTAVVVDGQIFDQQPVAIVWSADESLTACICPQVAHYTGQAELADSIRLGMEARASGHEDLATEYLGRAVLLAAQSGNDEATHRLRKVVDIEDAATGTVRLRRDVKKIDALEAEVGATRTVRARKKT
jgi:hypothetical protein